MKEFKYKIVERRSYVNKKETLIERIDKHGHHHYSEKIAGKTRPITPEMHTLKTTTFFNKLSETKEAPKALVKKADKIKEQEQYDEYEYFVGFDYETPKTSMIHGRHNFHAEYKVTSPIKLNPHEIKQMILSKFSDYSNVLKEDGYEIKSESQTKVNERPSFDAKIEGTIKRR